MKIYLQTEIVDEFEFDALESFCTLPMITEKKMIITNFLGLIYLTENTLRKVSNELKKLLDKVNCNIKCDIFLKYLIINFV